MHPTLEPINTVIKGTEDLDYVNQRLERSGVYYTTVRAVKSGQGSLESSSTAFTSLQSCDIVDTDMEMASRVWGHDIFGDLKPISTASDPFFSLKGPRPKPLSLISPDSKIRCDSPDCPIKSIPHNIGRYYDDGVRPLKEEADDIIRFFRYTVPPSDICGAYMRMRDGKASQIDKDKVRQYQKHHTWSLINSEPSTPRLYDPHGRLPASYARLVATESNIITSHGVIESSESSQAPPIPERNPLRIQIPYPPSEEPSTPRLCDPHGRLPVSHARLVATESNIITSHGVIESSESSQAPPIPERNPLRIQISYPLSEEPLRSLCTPGIKDDDDDEIDASDGLFSGNTENTVIYPRYAMAGSYAEENEDEAPIGPGARRDVPEGPELRRVQLRLQANIIGQIGQLVHGPDSPATDWDGLVADWRNGTD